MALPSTRRRSTGCRTAMIALYGCFSRMRSAFNTPKTSGIPTNGVAGGCGTALPASPACACPTLPNLGLLKQALREHFRSINVHIEVFQRHRQMLTEGTCLLTQVTI